MYIVHYKMFYAIYIVHNTKHKTLHSNCGNALITWTILLPISMTYDFIENLRL